MTEEEEEEKECMNCELTMAFLELIKRHFNNELILVLALQKACESKLLTDQSIKIILEKLLKHPLKRWVMENIPLLKDPTFVAKFLTSTSVEELKKKIANGQHEIDYAR